MSASKKKQIRREAELANPALTEKQKQELKTAKAHKRNVILGIVIGVVALILVAALLIWNSGLILRHTTAAEVKDTKLTVADMEYYYQVCVNQVYNTQQMYQQFGMEFTSPFDPAADYTTQTVDASLRSLMYSQGVGPEEGAEDQNYHDYFLECSKLLAAHIVATNDAAKAAGYTLSEDAQKELDEAKTSLKAQATSSGFGSSAAFLRAMYGRSMNERVYLKNIERYVTYTDYQQSVLNDMGGYSDEEIESYYGEHTDTLDSYSYHTAYMDGTVASKTDDDGNTVQPTDEEKKNALADAKKKADELLAAVKNAEPAEGGETATDIFTANAAAYTTNYAVRTNTLGTSIPDAFSEWLFSSERKAGDIDVFEVTDSGYYVVQFDSRARDDNPLIDVRHILIKGEDKAADDENTGTTNSSEDETRTMAEAKAEAEKILKEYTDSETPTAESFGELAEKYSEDGRSGDENKLQQSGGLYSGVKYGEMVKAFNDWIFDESRKEGDTDIVQTEYGYHVMYFQARNDPAWKTAAQNSKKSEEQEQWLDKTYEGYETIAASGLQKVHER